MKQTMRRMLSSILAVIMLLSCASVAFAAETAQMTESDAGLVTLKATDVTLTSSTEEQSASITFYVDKNIQLGSAGVTYTVADATDKVTLGTAAAETGLAASATISEGFSLANSNGVYVSAYSADVEGYVLFTLPVTVAANTTGEYVVTFTVNDLADADTGDGYNLASSTVTASIKVEAASTTSTGITLTAAATNDNPVRVGATNPIKVNVGVGQNYAATEMTITYPSSLVSFDQTNSTLGTNASVTDDGNGTLKLADYGEDKTAGTENYVLAFAVNATSANTAEFKVTQAGVGTGTSAVNANLTAIADEDLGSVSIAIEAAQYTVTLPTDGLFYAENTVVEAGGTFTFYPEQSTGGYYDYTTPTATYADGTDATVTETSDGTGWQIENVNGNVTIAAGSRTPKNFGAITYTGTGADKVTNQTTTATYLTDIVFTIPADVDPGTENGVKYEVAAKIGTANHTFGNPTTNADGSRTYTIPGTSVIGAVTITVTATTLEANKVTVSIDGNSSSDGSFEDTDAGASVQVDKTTGSATLTVDTESGLNKGYNYEVTTSAGTLTENADGTYTITGLTSDATITINKTINVDGVKNAVTVGSETKSYVTLNSESGEQMWLIQLPNNVENTTTAVYKYNGQQMYWSADHSNYVIVVISTEAPAITADMFTLESVTATPTVASNDWDVNKSGTLDANDAQLIWNMYKAVYTQFDTNADGATVEKFMLADANHDGILDLNDATVIINQIMGTNAG